MAKELFNPPVQTDVSGARVRDRLNCEGADILGFLLVSPDDPPVPNDDPIRLFWLQNPPGTLYMWSEQFKVWFPIAGEHGDPFGIFFGGDAASTFPNDINGGDSASVFEDDVFGGDASSVNGADVLGSFFPGGGGGPP